MSNNEGLIDFINKTSPEKLQVEEDLGSGFVRLNISEAQRRQAKHDIRCVEGALVELLRNSRDANAKHIYVASWKENNLRNIVIIDDGGGIPQKLHSRIFEPRVTSKLDRLVIDNYGVHGRGMALYSIRENCLLCKVMFSESKKVTAIKLIADTAKLPEKANQSSWPSFDSRGDIKEGPKNLIRHCLEFNLQHHNLKLYMGSPAQILAIIIANPKIKTENISPQLLYELASNLGLEVSLRNCQRVAYGEIEEVQDFLEQANHVTISRRQKKTNNISAVISREDLRLILEKIKLVVDEKAKDYFIAVSEDANIRRVGNKLEILLPLEIKE